MSRSAEQLEQAIATLESHRAVLGDAAADTALAALQAELAALAAAGALTGAAAGGRPLQQLRLVSVLFLDVVGSTALARGLDPEDIQSVMDGALAAFTRRIDEHGGLVMQYAGDSLLAAFGTEEVHEDDAERAVLAGLALLREAGRQAEQVEARFGQRGFGVRVGVSSGSVLVGGGVDGEHSIRGITVNIAARMEQTAPPGGLRISHDTWRLVRGLFDCEEQVPLLVKGRDEPMRTHLVRGALAVPEPSALRRGVQGLRAALVGREAELARLEALHDEVARGQRGFTLVALVGDAGLGKSRLLEEFDRRIGTGHGPAPGAPPAVPPHVAAAGARRWSAAAFERRRGRPYGVLRHLLLADGGASEALAPDEQRARWIARAEPVLQQRGNVAVLGQLLGLDFADEPEANALRADPKSLRDRAFFHATQLVAHAVAVAPPLVLALDDLHWADEGSIDFIEHLQRTQPDWPLLVLVLARPALFERRPAFGGARLERIELHALGAAHCRNLAQALLARLPAAPESLLRSIAAGGDGNPFFMEELVNMLIDRGAIVVDATAWRLEPDRQAQASLPTTLQGVLQARLDALPAARRRALQLAAVAGVVFWNLSLAALDAHAVTELDGLERRELIEAHATSRLAGAREYAFRHQTLHRVAYDGVLKRIKRAAHLNLARWFDAQPGREGLQDQIAAHYEQGGERALARDAWQRAAESARTRFANLEALAHVEHALAMTAEDELPQRLALTLMLVRVLEIQRDREGLAQALDRFEALAAQHGDPGWASELAVRRANFAYHRGQAAEALAFARRAVELCPGADTERAARANNALFHALARLASVSEALAAAEAALGHARAGGHDAVEAVTLNSLGQLFYGQGDIGRAQAYFQQALALHRARGHLANEAGTRSNLAFMAMAVGDFELALAEFEQAQALSEQVGQLQNAGIVRINRALALLQLGRGEAALDLASRALVLVTNAGDRWARAAALRVAGQAALALGRHTEAQAQLVASRELFDELGMRHLAMESLASLVDEALARGDRAAALEHAEAIVARRAAGASLDGCDEPLHVMLAVGLAFEAAADARAEAALEAAEAELLARAGRLADPAQRARFLGGVSYHRAIVEARARARENAGGPVRVNPGS